MVPFASASSLYDENVNWMHQWHPAATPDQVAEIAGLLTSAGINMNTPATQLAGVGGIDVGEIWGICQDVGWFVGGVNPCPPAGPPPAAVCTAVAAHWALFIWAPVSNEWTVSGGTPGFSPIRYAWTTGHLGLGPLGTLQATHFLGSGCTQEFRFAPGDELVVGYGDGIGMNP
jgi:hypothetical protein